MQRQGGWGALSHLEFFFTRTRVSWLAIHKNYVVFCSPYQKLDLRTRQLGEGAFYAVQKLFFNNFVPVPPGYKCNNIGAGNVIK
jgi:hypothetical protein